MARPKGNVDLETVAKAEYPVESVADILEVSTRSVFRWIAKFREGGTEG